MPQGAHGRRPSRPCLPRARQHAGLRLLARLAGLVSQGEDRRGGARRPRRLRTALRGGREARRATLSRQSAPTFEVVERIAWRGGKAFSHVDFGALGTCGATRQRASDCCAGQAAGCTGRGGMGSARRCCRGCPGGVAEGSPWRRSRSRRRLRPCGRRGDGLRAQTWRPAPRRPTKEPQDRDEIEAVRADILAAISGARAGAPPTEKGWLPRYAARRIAWHVLDHAWEIEDRS